MMGGHSLGPRIPLSGNIFPSDIPNGSSLQIPRGIDRDVRTSLGITFIVRTSSTGGSNGEIRFMSVGAQLFDS